MAITGDAGFLKATCKLTLESAPVACAPLGHGWFCVVDAAANCALLSISPAAPAAPAAPDLRGECTLTVRCFPAVYGRQVPRPHQVGAEDAGEGCEEPLGGAAKARAARHASAACALPCSHVPAMQSLAALVVVGTLAGPGCVVGVPRAGLESALRSAPDDTAHSMCAATTPHNNPVLDSPLCDFAAVLLSAAVSGKAVGTVGSGRALISATPQADMHAVHAHNAELDPRAVVEHGCHKRCVPQLCCSACMSSMYAVTVKRLYPR